MRYGLIVLVLLGSLVPARGAANLKPYDSPYYIIHTDLEVDDAREASLRMTRMAEEYISRTREFSGQIRGRLPFYLFKNKEDYYAAGALPGSAGVFTGTKLMAIAGPKGSGGTWHIVQHEGFHQFAAACIGRLPTWINEGLAEYFAEAIFTGDGFVTGLIPPGRLKRIKAQIEEKKLKTIEQMMLLSHAEWNAELGAGKDGNARGNYDQGWSMVHFLAHADNGKYQKPFGRFLIDMNNRRPWKEAWANNFGTDIAAFEARWREYWTGLPESPTTDLYLKAVCATFTSYLARAASQKQTFDSFEEFVKAAESGGLKAHPEDWLPPSLIEAVLPVTKKIKGFTIDRPVPSGSQRLMLEQGEVRWAGTFTLKGNRVGKVSVDLPTKTPAAPLSQAKTTPPATLSTPAAKPAATTRPAASGTKAKADPVASAMSLARSYRQLGDTAKAKAALEKAVAENPTSPLIGEAKKLLAEMK